MSFLCLRRSSKASWSLPRQNTKSEPPNGRVTIVHTERNNLRPEFDSQENTQENEAKRRTFPQENERSLLGANKVVTSDKLSDNESHTSNTKEESPKTNNLRPQSTQISEKSLASGKMAKKKSQAPKPQQNINSTGTAPARDKQQVSLSIESEESQKIETLNSETGALLHGMEDSTLKTTKEVLNTDNVHSDLDINDTKTEISKSGDEYISSNGYDREVKAVDSEEELPEADIGTKLSVHSISELERNSVDVQIRRRSRIIVRPVTYNENNIGALPVYPKDRSDEELISKALLDNEFLGRLLKEGKRLQDVINAMYSRDIKPNEIIIKEGETGNHMYVSAKGNYEVTIAKQGVVSSFNDARVFGELALLHNAKRLATISATTNGKVWVLDQDVYNQLMVRTNIEEQDEILSFLNNVEKLNSVKPETLRHVAKLLKVEYFKGGTEIVRQGEKGDKFYIIRAGSVTITKENEGVVNNFGKGKYFGELALLKEDTRQATVTADPPVVECFTLTRKQFINNFGEVDDIANITISTHVPKISVVRSIKSEYDDIDLMELQIKATLGVGGFGRVELVQHKKKQDLTFALKYLKKYDMVEQQQEEHVKNERNIQMSCRSIFIVRLYRTYKDIKYVYFLMESCLGGDLWNLLQKQKSRRFEEKNARFIAACVLESIGYLHERGIVYRDLKPENLMIDAEGYIKLTDFGFAKKLSPGGRTYTFAGTPEYVAPEIVLNRGHDKSVDYWAFGIFIYELLSGRTPFRTGDPNHMKTYNRILSGIDKVQFPTYIPFKAKHIIEKLCRPLPTERLGYQRGGIKDIKNHKWFLGFDWTKLNDHKLASPFRPKLSSNIDTQYFDTFKKDFDIPPDETSGWDDDF